MKFVDIHSHLDSCKNIPEIVESCNGKNILIVTCGTDIKSNRRTLELKRKYPEIKICLGIYPLDGLKMSDEEINSEIEFVRKNKYNIFGVGEVGLDLHMIKDSKSFEKQKKVFGKFIELARELNKPVFVHSRDAEKETIDFIEKFDYDKIIMHCFSGNMKLVRRIIENDWKLSIPASVKYNKHFQKIAKVTPVKNLFCETDSPFLHPLHEENNTSENVIESYKKISEIKGLDLETVEDMIWNNFLGLSKV